MRLNLILVLLLTSPYTLADQTCDKNNSEKIWDGKTYLEANYAVTDESSSKVKNWGLGAGVSVDCYTITPLLHFSWDLGLYYKNSTTTLANSTDKTRTTGIKIGKFTYKGSDNFIPQFTVAYEKIDKTVSGVNSKFDAIAYGLGLSFQLTDIVSVKLEHAQSYENLLDDLVKKETTFGITYTYVIN